MTIYKYVCITVLTAAWLTAAERDEEHRRQVQLLVARVAGIPRTSSVCLRHSTSPLPVKLYMYSGILH